MEDVEKAGASSSNDRMLEAGDGAKQPVSETRIEPAPSYNLMSRVKAAKQEAGDDQKAFFLKFIAIVFGSVYALVFLALTMAIPIAMIAIGSVYLKDCNREKYIPIYLIVGGCFGILSQLLRIIRQMKTKDDEDPSANKGTALEGLLSCFLFAWFIAGNVWVYRIVHDFTTENPEADDYCHPTLYWFSFWLITVTYILFIVCCGGVCLFGICCALICSAANK